MNLKRAVVCFVTVSGVAMISGCGQETPTSEAESASGKQARVTDEAGTSRQAGGDPGDGNRELRDRYGIGADETSSRQSEPATKPAFQMDPVDPVLAERYGLPPRGGAADSGRDETASGPYEMDPVLAERYGLAPPGDAASSEQDAQPPSNLPLPEDGRRAGTPSAGLAEGILDAEASGDLNQAIEAYRGVIEEFDALREDAAQAVFRLGEAYRRQGKSTEARSQYERILREFSDQEELTRMSLDRMSDQQALDGQIPRYRYYIPEMSVEAYDNQIALLQEEVAIIESELRTVELLMDAGQGSPSDKRMWQREVLALNREISQLEAARKQAADRTRRGTHGASVRAPEAFDSPQSFETQLSLFQEELKLVEQQIASTELHAKAGRIPSSTLTSLKREELEIKRQIAALEDRIKHAWFRAGNDVEGAAAEMGIPRETMNDYRVLVTRVNNLIQKEAELRARYTDEHPDLVQARRDRAELEARMKEFEAKNPGIEELVRSRKE